MDTDASQTTFTVSELTQKIKSSLEGSFSNVSLQGEISNFKQQSSGHLYFTLKDQGAQISAVMFRGYTTTLARIPRDGDQVTVSGDISVYAPRGNYQLIVKSMQHAGVGELLLRLEALKKEIHARGWFRKEHKKAIPSSPHCIGVITSPTGAAIRDILSILSTRRSRFRVLLNPVRVQGAEAAGEIAAAIEQMNQHKLCDVLIVGRGGGSIEDLWPFNEETVASALFHSEIPTICAVGHETDHCIAEYVADVRAPTPTAAAQLAIAEQARQEETLQTLQKRIQTTLQHLIARYKTRLSFFAQHPFFASPYALLGPYLQRIDDFRYTFDRNIRHQLENKKITLKGFQRQLLALQPKTKIHHMRQRLLSMQHSIDSSVMHTLKSTEATFRRIVEMLAALDPKNVLKKGYTITFHEKGESVIFSSRSLRTNDKVKIRFSDGEAAATIDEVRSHGD